jgi:hypothetical protein
MPTEALVIIGFVVLCAGVPIVITLWLMRKFGGIGGTMKNGIPAVAVIESIAETGMTITSPSIGPDAAVYKLGLLVTPPGDGTPYKTEVTQAIPRIFIPMIVPGAKVGIVIDPADQQHVDVDWQRFGAGQAGAADAAAGGFMQIAGVNVGFDAAGNPAGDGLAALVSGVRSGAVPQIKGSAAQLLATGTHGTAVITTAQPLGKTVRDINPAADADKLNDPMWLFTLEVSLAGQAPFPAMFGHRVPLAKVASIAPGVKLAVAVNEAERNADVAIDWDRSPLS